MVGLTFTVNMWDSRGFNLNNMSQKQIASIFDYFFLFLIIFVGFWSVLFFRGETTVQIFAAILMGAGYVLWGILHHMGRGNIRPKIVVEYLVFATIVVTILTILILRS